MNEFEEFEKLEPVDCPFADCFGTCDSCGRPSGRPCYFDEPWFSEEDLKNE